MQQKKRVQSFDGFKALAIIAVVAYHLFPSVVPGGFYMVNAFLVVAGFFFAHNLEKIQPVNEPIHWKKVGLYLLKTIERLFIPLLWFFIAIVIGLFFLYPQELRHLRSDIISGLTFTSNIYQIIEGKSYFVQMTDASPFTHLWYNALHLQSVLISSVLMVVLQKLRLKVPAKGIIWLAIVMISQAILTFLYQPGQDPTRVYYGIETRFASFAMGVATAYITPTILNLFYKAKWKYFIYNLLGVVAFAAMAWIVFTKSDQMDDTYLLWLSVFNGLSMLAVFSITAGAPLLTRLLSLPLLHHIGKRSYSYYLWYYPIIVFYLSFYRQLGENMAIINGLSIITLIVVGEIFYRLFESGKYHIWFGSTFSWKQDVDEIGYMIEERNFLNPKLASFIAYISLLVIFGKAIQFSADDKRVALFELEYQEYQTKVNLQKLPYPAQRSILATQTDLNDIDTSVDTHFIKPLNLQDPVESLIDTYRKQVVYSQEIQSLIDDNQAVFDQFEAENPIVYDELTPQELLYATEVPVTFFGDSIALHFTPKVDEIFWQGNIFGQGSLQIWDANDILRGMVDRGEVQANLVVVLGTNAGLDQEAMDELMAIAGPDRQVFFVNTNSRVQHIAQVNQTIKDTAAKYANAHEVDWYSYQQGNPDWYTEDEVHHTPEGMQHFAVIVTQTLYNTLKDAPVE